MATLTIDNPHDDDDDDDPYSVAARLKELLPDYHTVCGSHICIHSYNWQLPN